jgi:two-component system, OmpR family, phosphate regulon sensor histidine kinase PhoR
MSGPSTRSLFLRLLLAPLIVVVAVALSLYVYSDTVVQRLYLDTLADEALHQAKLVGAELPWDIRGASFDARCASIAALTGSRITVMAVDGTVLGDSDAASASLENHRDRPEVRAALRDGVGHDTRLSVSVKQPLFYHAWKQIVGDDSRIVRLAIPLTRVQLARGRIHTALWSGLILAAALSVWPVWRITRRTSQRLTDLTEFTTAIAAGREPQRVKPSGDDVLGKLERNVVAMADSLRRQLRLAQDDANKLEATLGGMVEGVLVIDRSGTVHLSNQRSQQLLGVGDASLVGRLLIDINRDPELHDLVRTVLSTTDPTPVSREITLHQPSELTLGVTASPIAGGHAEDGLYILVFGDITDLKKLEATRRDFVANVSHELRTPLTAIRGYAETLLAGSIEDPELARRFVAVIERHSERLSRLTDDLLTLSDLELGRASLHPEAIDVEEAVAAAVDIIRDKAKQKGIALVTTMAADLPKVWADADRIEQVLLNLLDNAVKYTLPDGKVSVVARSVSRPAGTEVELSVADSGVGIPSQDIPRLTERFYRVDKARSRELGGTGLGLAIVKHIVQLHGGSLHIDSELGKGTTVRVGLPAA